jgi:thiamine biosynthesis protein ThiS
MQVKIFNSSIFFNGDFYNFKSYKIFTLDDLRIFLNYKKKLIIIEHNNKIISAENWDRIYLKNKDKVEILTIVGGG